MLISISMHVVTFMHARSFDEGAVLRCEMARKNMYIKDDPSAKRQRTGPGGYAGAGAYPAPASHASQAPYRAAPGGGVSFDCPCVLAACACPRPTLCEHMLSTHMVLLCLY